MTIRRFALVTLATCLAAPVMAEDIAAVVGAIPGGPVAVNVSYAINEPISSTEPAALAAVDAAYRKSLLLRAEGECTEFLATIATDCAVTGISISTQVNSYPSQAPTLYVTSNVTLQITLRKASE